MKLKKNHITILVILAVIVLAIIVLNLNGHDVEKETAKCIGEKSVVYIQLGCHACEKQEELFGENYQELNIVDCFYEQELCSDNNITATPTWIIDGESYVGVQSIQELKNLTGC